MERILPNHQSCDLTIGRLTTIVLIQHGPKPGLHRLLIQRLHLDHILIRIDPGCKAVILTGHNHLTHQWAESQFVLNLFRRDILTVGQDDQVLHTSVDEEESVLIDISLIPCVQPSIRQSLLRLLRHFVIPLHDTAALHLNLTVHEADLHILKRTSDGTCLMIIGHIGADDRRALGHSIALQHFHTVLPELLYIKRIQMCSARENDLQPAAEYLGRHRCLRNRRIHRCQFLVNGLDHKRYHQNNIRLIDRHIPDHMHKVIIDADHCSQGESLQPVHDQTERMMYRKDAHKDASRILVVPDILHVIRKI